MRGHWSKSQTTSIITSCRITWVNKFCHHEMVFNNREREKVAFKHHNAKLFKHKSHLIAFHLPKYDGNFFFPFFFLVLMLFNFYLRFGHLYFLWFTLWGQIRVKWEQRNNTFTWNLWCSFAWYEKIQSRSNVIICDFWKRLKNGNYLLASFVPISHQFTSDWLESGFPINLQIQWKKSSNET